MSSTSRPNDIARVFGGTIPTDTRGILIERLIPSPGQRGGRRERVDYVLPEACSSRLRDLTGGRYRVACIGPRGAIKGGARVVEARGDGSLPRAVPPRTSRDYPRTPRARKRTRLRARLKTTRARLQATTQAKRGAGRKVQRRDARIRRERADRARREKSLRVELRAARRATRVAIRARDKACAYAEKQERARVDMERRALAEAQARAAADAEVLRLREELRALKSAQTQTPPRPSPPRRSRVVAAPPAPAVSCVTTEGASSPRPPTPPIHPEASAHRPGPGPDEQRLRVQLSARESALAATQHSVARLDGLLRQVIAERDAARAVAAQRGALLDRVTWSLGGAAVLAIVLHFGKALRRAGSEVQVGGGAAEGRLSTDGGLVATAAAGVGVSRGASSAVESQWSGPPIILSSGASGRDASVPDPRVAA